MNITITRTGGLHGPAIREILGPVDTNARGWEALKEKIELLVEEMGYFDLPPQIPSQGGADVFFYRTVIADGERYNQVVSDDVSEEPYHGQLGTLIDLLREGGADFVPQTAGEDIDWDTVSVIPLFVEGFLVIVQGIASVPTLVSFEPDPTEQYVDYAPVHVVGRKAAITIEVETPWQIQAPLESLPSGPKGTVLIGATKRHYIPPRDIPTIAPY